MTFAQGWGHLATLFRRNPGQDLCPHGLDVKLLSSGGVQILHVPFRRASISEMLAGTTLSKTRSNEYSLGL